MKSSVFSGRSRSESGSQRVAVGVLLGGLLLGGCQSAESDTGSTELRNGTGTLQQIQNFGANPGGLQMFLYAPDTVAPDAPVVVLMHGCTQQVSTFRTSGWEALADDEGFYLVYPQQTTGNNPVRCFNWAGEYGDEANLVRGQGENQSIVSMVDYVLDNFATDEDRVFAVGFSAGAAKTAVMLSTWPDRFAGGAINAGVPYRCATSVTGAFSCQNPGRNLSPSQWGDLVRNAYGTYEGPYPRVSIWHGTQDSIVAPMNGVELAEQWSNVHGISSTPSSTDVVDGQSRDRYDSGGELLVEHVTVSGMGHALAIDPSSGCGGAAAYMDDRGVCAAYRQAEFFGLLGDGAGSAGTSSSSSGGESSGGETGDNSSSGESSGGSGETGDPITADEVASGSCTIHYVSQRLDVAGYLGCGSTYGYIAQVPMYRFGSCWTFDESGSGC